MFVALTINAGVLAIGGNIALTGIILSKLRASSDDIQMTKDEESWFGKIKTDIVELENRHQHLKTYSRVC